jgi:4-amino-4-deoxy-L-arabinose transferase-like glycosyltransferase
VTRHPRAAALALVVATAVLYLQGLGSSPLLEPDEGRYAEIPREMVASGDWLVPHRDGFVYLQKPPLGYWLTAVVYRVTGSDQRSARLAPALSAVATVGVAAWFGTYCFGGAAGLAGAAMLATTPLFFVFGRLAILDMHLTLFLTLAVAFLYRAVEDGRRRWRLAAGCAMAAAVLTKGLVGVVLPVGLVLAAAAMERDRTIVRRALGPATLLPVVLLPLPWFWAVGMRVDGFLAFFFVRHHLMRYAVGGKIGHHQPPWFLAAVLLGGALPWSLVLGSAWARGRRAPWRDPARRAERWLGLWLVIVVGFYSLSRASIATYVCPAFVPLALVAGQAWVTGRAGRWPVVAWGVLAALVLALTLLPEAAYGPFVGRVLYRRWWVEAQALRPLLAVAAGVVLGGGVAAMAARRRGAMLATLVLSLAAGLARAERARGAFTSYAALGTVIRARGGEADRVVTYGRLLEGLPFYARRRITLVAWDGTEDFGGGPGDARALRWSERRLVRAWNGRCRIFLVIAPEAWRRLRPRLRRAPVVLASEHGRILVSNAPLGVWPPV